MQKPRDTYLDCLKGLLIFLVVFGHCIQYGSGAEYLQMGGYWENPVMKAIYSFHMPLFVFISGYLAYYSARKYGVVDACIRRWKHLIVPIASWVPIVALLNIVIDRSSVDVKDIIRIFLTDFWFLWTILVSITVVTAAEKIPARYKTLFYTMVVVACFLLPDMFWAHAHKFMLPYYVAGYYIARRRGNLEVTTVKGVVSSIVWVSLMLVYSKDAYIYNSLFTLVRNADGFSWKQQLLINIYRYFVGAVGCITILFVTQRIWRLIENRSKPINGLIWMGKHSLSIYILTTYIFVYLIPAITKSVQQNYILNFIETWILIIICRIITQKLKKVPILAKALIGE